MANSQERFRGFRGKIIPQGEEGVKEIPRQENDEEERARLLEELEKVKKSLDNPSLSDEESRRLWQHQIELERKLGLEPPKEDGNLPTGLYL